MSSSGTSHQDKLFCSVFTFDIKLIKIVYYRQFIEGVINLKYVIIGNTMIYHPERCNYWVRGVTNKTGGGIKI